VLQRSRATLSVLVRDMSRSCPFASNLFVSSNAVLLFLASRPYDDPWLITAQILTIASIGFAWVYWVTFVVNLVGIALFQIPWCARMRSGPLYGHAVIAGVLSVANLIVGSYILESWKAKRYCDPFYFYTNDWFYDDDSRNWPNVDNCYEKTWFAIAFVCALLWASAMGCMIWFVKSGRHAKWEEKLTLSMPSTEVEITATPSNGVAERETAIVGASVLEAEKENSV